MIVVYKATFENGKFYIGITNNLDKRKHSHNTKVKRGSNLYFHNAIRKYGFNTIKWEVLSHHNTREEAEIEEIRLIKELKPEYNIAPGGSSPKIGEETKKKMSKAKSGKRFSEEARKNMSIAQRELADSKGFNDNTGTHNDPKMVKEAFLRNFNNGGLKEEVVERLKLLNSIYKDGMSLNELSSLTGISYAVIIRYQWMWTRLDEYIPREQPSKKGYKFKLNKEKDIRWRQKAGHKKIKNDRIYLLANLDLEDKTLKEISDVSGLTLRVVERLNRSWEDMILEEGF